MAAACHDCCARPAHAYIFEDRWFVLCVRCARAMRPRIRSQHTGITRQEWIERLGEFFREAGVHEICRRCHEQGTGCCPASCGRLTPQGCRESTLWCSAFVCSALMLAIEDADPDSARELKRIRRDIGPWEYPLFQIVTRVPFSERQPERHLAIAQRVPEPNLNPAKLREKLLERAANVLEIRRLWSGQESPDSPAIPAQSA